MMELNFLLVTFLIIFLLRALVQLYLHRLNVSFLAKHGLEVPEILKDAVDQNKLKKILSYTMDSDRLSIIDSLVNQGIILLILFSGFLPWLVKTIHSWGNGMVIEGLIFFGILAIIGTLFHLPFNLYDTFVIEDRYGFNTMTLKLWVIDFLKTTIIVAILGGLALWFLLTLIIWGGTLWWIWACILLNAYEVLLLWIFPVVIAPFFNKFEPIVNNKLESQIRELMEKVGIQIGGLFKMDAGKRSKHTNAYFTGIGKTKRIVLFDTLLASHSEDEILSILSHEIGHWKKKHLLKQIILMGVISLIVFWGAAKLIKWPLLYQTFGFEVAFPYVGLFLTLILFNLFNFFTQPFHTAISRRFERDADDFAVKLMETSDPLQNALKRLASDNLANLTPHPLYAWFYYSHPPLPERIERIRLMSK